MVGRHSPRQRGTEAKKSVEKRIILKRASLNGRKKIKKYFALKLGIIYLSGVKRRNREGGRFIRNA